MVNHSQLLQIKCFIQTDETFWNMIKATKKTARLTYERRDTHKHTLAIKQSGYNPHNGVFLCIYLFLKEEQSTPCWLNPQNAQCHNMELFGTQCPSARRWQHRESHSCNQCPVLKESTRNPTAGP